MNGKTHAGVSAVAYVTLCNNTIIQFSYIGIAVAIFAALLPDIDHPKSIFNRYILFVRNKSVMTVFYICLGIIVLWMDYIYFNNTAVKSLAASFIVVAFSSHRNGLTHSLTGLIIFTIIANSISNIYGFKDLSYIFMVGYGSHLLCDMATNRGIPLFYPFSKKKYKFPFTYRVGSKIGNFIELCIMIVGLLYIVYTLPSFLGFNLLLPHRQ